MEADRASNSFYSNQGHLLQIRFRIARIHVRFPRHCPHLVYRRLPTKHALTLSDRKDLKRICNILANYTEIMEALNEDSKHSSKGGAFVEYEVKIELKEEWG